MYPTRNGNLNTGEVRNGNCCGSARNNAPVNSVKKTIHTVGINNLKKRVKLEETLIMAQDSLSASARTRLATWMDNSYKIYNGMPIIT